LVDVFEDLRQQSRGPAIVLDEAGQALGVVTLEDFLAELVGKELDTGA
jgi:CBS domain containing-hemolysin-like protein